MANTSTPPPTEYLTLRQASDLLQVSERTLWELARDKKVPSFRVGAQFRFRRASIDEYAAEGGAK